MAKAQNFVAAFAEKGAALRLFEIEEERQSILKKFPRLQGKTFSVYLPSNIVGKKVGDVIKREKPKGPENTMIRAKRRVMTAQARHAVSLRMKKYWAQRRAHKTKGGKKQ